jgi:hypothetical protein
LACGRRRIGVAAAAVEEREEKRRARNSPGARLFGQAQYLKNQIHPEYVLKLGLLAYFPGTNRLELLFHSTGSAQVSSKLVVRRVFPSRVAAVAFELHLNDDVVHQTTAGDTCLLMAGVTVTAKDVAASTRKCSATVTVRQEGSVAVCAVQ